MKNRHQLLAATALASLAPSTAVWAQTQTTAEPANRDEIIVTATRRESVVLDIPYNISVISGDDLAVRGITDLAGLRNAAPGLTAPDYGVRGNGLNNAFIIRGVNTDAAGGPTSAFPKLQGSSTSTYVDEIPLFQNLQLTDIARVEVLRGPQGTLFGAGSVGGTIRIIRNRPELGTFDYMANADVSGTDDSGELNYSGDAVVNFPLGDDLALRVSGGFDHTAGFIDAIGVFQFDSNGEPSLANPSDPLNSGPVIRPRIKDIDWSESWFVRGALRWQLSDMLDAELSYQHQNDTAGGFNAQTVGLRNETRKRAALEPLETTTDLAALTVTADFGFATLTSATAWYDVSTDSLTDGSATAQSFAAYYGFYPRLVAPSPDDIGLESFSQELRLVSNGEGRFDYIVGAYFQKQNARYDQYFVTPGFSRWAQLPGSALAAEDYFGIPLGSFATYSDFVQDVAGGTRPEDWPIRDAPYEFRRRIEQKDYAIFGELTFRITDAWDVTGGARVFWQDFAQDTRAFFYPINFESGAVGSTDLQDQIFKVNTSYELTDNLLAYATFSQGFRSGGANSIRPCQPGQTTRCDPPELASYAPDTVDNYELGLKGRVADGVTFSANVFQMDWSGVQVERGSFDGTPIVVNGNTARSRGFEFEGFARLSDRFNLSAGYSLTDSKLTEDFSSGGLGGFQGEDGDKLPGVSRHQLNVALDYGGPLTADTMLFVNLNGNWRSSFDNVIDKDAPGYRELDSYGLVNASVAVELKDRYRVTLFATNLFNEEGISGASAGGRQTPPDVLFFSLSEFVSRPRTIGIRFSVER